MLQEITIAIVGPGVMGKTIATSLIQTGRILPGRIIMAGPNPERLKQLQAELGLRWTASNAEAASAADVVILAVKPQRLDQAARSLKGALKPGTLVISILAGAPLLALEQKLGTRCLVRAMPNTPARIGMGITVWTKAADVDEAQHEIAEMLTDADTKIAAEEDRKAALQDLFKSTLHQLMTGQVRLLSDEEVLNLVRERRE